jgi:hypothetical protein
MTDLRKIFPLPASLFQHDWLDSVVIVSVKQQEERLKNGLGPSAIGMVGQAHF